MLRSVFISAIVLFCTSAFAAAPSFDAVRAAHTASDALLFDRHGVVIHEFRVDPQGRKLEWVGLSQMSPALKDSVVQSEDKRFYGHHGVDWLALASAAAGNLFSQGHRGASTISMQLASIIEKGLKPRKAKRTAGQKWDQIRAGLDLEKTWTKDQILEAYLNLVTFRGELQGIAAASRGLFGKDPGGLDQAEASVLAALIRAPNAPTQKVSERALLLGSRCTQPASPERITAAVQEALLKPHAIRKQADLAPHVAQRLLGKGTRSARSSIDAALQRFSTEALMKAVAGLSGRNVRDGAVLVADNRSGEVLAYVGNTRTLSSAPAVDGVRARRQAGSTLKPFLYGLALEQKIITPASLIEDSPLDIPTGRGLYRPENYDKEFRGMVTARDALASSLNIPAVRTIGLVGTSAFAGKLKEFGFTSLEDAQYYGPSLALGSADVTLWELVNAYRTLANKGVRTGLRLTPAGPSTGRSRALSPEAAFLVSDILSDREARSTTFSLENPLATRFWTAVKTGTSKDMRDNWCVGYSSRFTVGVWVGNFSGEPMWNVSGISGAAPVWLEIMNELHRDRPSRAPAAPAGIVVRQVARSERGDVRKELFISGTERESIGPAEHADSARITYPAEGMIIAVDPDIPTDLQQLLVTASAADEKSSLVLDDQSLGSAPSVRWHPVPGKHVLSLVRAEGAIMDRVTFEVR